MSGFGDVKPYCSPVLAENLVKGSAYYILSYFDDKLTIPEVGTTVYIGKDIDQEKDEIYYFQDFESHSKFSFRKEDTIKNEFGNYDLILIDEAHNFRNKSSDIKRSKNIEKLKGKNFSFESAMLCAETLNRGFSKAVSIIGAAG